jgi:hypothetical protein
MSKSAKIVSPLRAAFKALMRSEDSRALHANLMYLWNRFMMRPSGDVKAKFWPEPRAIDQRPADEVTDEGFADLHRKLRRA